MNIEIRKLLKFPRTYLRINAVIRVSLKSLFQRLPHLDSRIRPWGEKRRINLLSLHFISSLPFESRLFVSYCTFRLHIDSSLSKVLSLFGVSATI